MKNFTQFTNKLFSAFFAALLFTLGSVNAQTVHFDDTSNPSKATSITGLTVNGTTYDVTFSPLIEAVNVYGAYPGTYTFKTESDATDAVTAMSAALNSAGALRAGIVGGIGYEFFTVIYESYQQGDFDGCNNIPGSREGVDSWDPLPTEPAFYNLDGRHWVIFDETSGTNELLSGVSISVFPNPATSFIQIETEAHVKSIEIYDVTGKVMQHFQLEADGSTTLDVSEFHAGMYFLKLQDDKGDEAIKKIIIQ